jgi:hypothetical protein
LLIYFQNFLGSLTKQVNFNESNKAYSQADRG